MHSFCYITARCYVMVVHVTLCSIELEVDKCLHLCLYCNSFSKNVFALVGYVGESITVNHFVADIVRSFSYCLQSFIEVATRGASNMIYVLL